MILPCVVCQKTFKTYPSKLALGRGKYCSQACCLKITGIKPGQRLSPETEIKKGQKPATFKGFRLHKARKNGKAYREIFLPDHPHSKRGYVREHRLVMEKHLGRHLRFEEVVHHINGNTLDNRLENLEVMSSADHRRLHLRDTIHRRWYDRHLSHKKTERTPKSVI